MTGKGHFIQGTLDFRFASVLPLLVTDNLDKITCGQTKNV